MEQDLGHLEARISASRRDDRHPGEPTNVRDRDKDAEYMINTVAQQQWLAEPGRRPR